MSNLGPNLPKDLVSVKRGAAIAQKSERTIWRDIRKGKLRGWGTRRCYLVSLSDLLPELKTSPTVMAGAGTVENASDAFLLGTGAAIVQDSPVQIVTLSDIAVSRKSVL